MEVSRSWCCPGRIPTSRAWCSSTKAVRSQRELRLGLGVLPDEHIRQGGERVLRYASGPAAAEARRQRPKPGRLRKERYFRRRARGIRQGGPRRRPARDERGRRDRLAWRHPRWDRLGARGASRRSRRNTEIRRRFMKAGWVLLPALLPATVQAQEPPFPQKAPIEITVLFPAGSSADVTARLLADGMSKQLGAKMIVFNRPGAGGAIGYKYVAAQKPDGYSIVWNSNSISTTFHSGLMPFDYRAFDPVARVLVESPVIAVHGESKWKTLAQLVADAKSRPKGITVGNSGIGSHTHISSVALFKAAGVEAVDVPFGAAQVVPSLLGGQVDAVVQLPAALSGYVKSGQVRLLASLTSARDPLLGDVPTARELGYDVALEAW